jgi:hypothetical protein
MKTIAIISALAGAAMLSSAALAQDAPEGDYVCLITFATPEEAAAGADEDALSAVYVTRDEAIAAAAASGGLQAYWDYTDDGYATNADEQEFCLTTFNPDDGEGANNSAKAFAPGQLKGEGETGKDYAPGQVKEDGETGKDNAPGQLKK